MGSGVLAMSVAIVMGSDVQTLSVAIFMEPGVSATSAMSVAIGV